MMFECILFDLVGTTVREEGDVIMSCFERAFSKHVPYIDVERLRSERGKEKTLMIASVLEHHQYSPSLVQPIYHSFKQFVTDSISRFVENDGAGEIFRLLKSKGIRIGIGTGLDREVYEQIASKLHWSQYEFDYVGIGNEMQNSRPQPDMIFDMMSKLSHTNTETFLKVGDTVADILEGKNAGVATAVILSGSQAEDELLRHNPDFVISSLLDIKKIFEQMFVE